MQFCKSIQSRVEYSATLDSVHSAMANGVTVVVIVILLTYSVMGSLPVRLSPLKTRFDFLIVTPTEPKELGYVHSYVSKPLGGYLEIVVTPLTGTLTNMELTGAQKIDTRNRS